MWGYACANMSAGIAPGNLGQGRMGNWMTGHPLESCWFGSASEEGVVLGTVLDRHFPLPCVAALTCVQPLLSPVHTWMHIPHSTAQLTEPMKWGLSSTLSEPSVSLLQLITYWEKTFNIDLFRPQIGVVNVTDVSSMCPENSVIPKLGCWKGWALMYRISTVKCR